MARIIPTLRYTDAPAALAWLRDVLGFEVRVRNDGADGVIEHAQLTLGDALVMLGSLKEGEEQVTPTLYVQLETDEAVVTIHDEVQAAGADITMALQHMDYGGAAFTVRDPEGVSWSYGSYDPWA